MLVYEKVLDQLIESGIDLYAGIVGSTSAPYVSSIVGRKNTRYIGVRHEQVAAAIVDAAARLTGRPGCVMTHGASGALAASLGVAAAAADSIPCCSSARRSSASQWSAATGRLSACSRRCRDS